MTLRGFVKARLGRGLCRALGQVRDEIALQMTHRRSVRKAARLSNASPLMLNCGSGENLKPGWINIDIGNKSADLQLDLRENLPFRDGSVSMIYSEHFFEHLAFPDEAKTFLTESLRVLIPGGRFRVGVPDTEWPLIAYVNGDEEYFQFVRSQWHPAWCDTRMHHINYHFRQGAEHKYAYDYDTLAKLLTQAGFVSVELSDFDRELDCDHRKIGTLYVNAFKGSPPIWLSAEEDLAKSSTSAQRSESIASR